MPKKKKTVYILGAGASKAVGIPLQSQLLSSIFSLEAPKPDPQKNFMELEINHHQEDIMKHYPLFVSYREKLSNFIINAFSSETFRVKYKASFILNQKLALSLVQQVNVTLEDLFTLFDKVSLGREHFKTYTLEEMDEIHTALKKCIIFVLAYQSALCKQDSSVYSVLAKKLINRRLEVTSEDDILAIITMNWDSVLEQQLYLQCKNYNIGKSKRASKVYLDLCFYDHPFRSDEERIVSTHIKAKGHRNIKFLKLHGSTNWLVCPFCGRVFVDFREDIAIYVYEVKCLCPYCSKEINSESDNEHAPQLRSMIITPTFLKDLNNLHLKNIWHNAFIDITEADHLVFIGYSFPDADFEMRCLLKKAVRTNTEIDVVLHSSDNPKYYRDIFATKGFIEDEIESITNKLHLPHFRYSSFFNKDRLHFHYEGIESYLE